MNTQNLSRGDAERVTLVVKNVDGGGSITTGLGVCLSPAAASIDGVSAVKATAALQRTFVGVAAQDIPINGFGLVTAWGLAASVLLSHVGTSITVTAGDTLKPGAVAGTYFSSVTDAAMSTLFYRYVVAADSITVSAAAYVRGIVRAL
jgi:hypothetical protein